MIEKQYPVRFVRIGGRFQYLKKEDVQHQLQPMVKTSLFTANINAIKTGIKALPWVIDAEVKRTWPDVIDIRIYEQQPLLRWGEQGLLNIKGRIFNAGNTSDFKNLPLLKCPLGQQMKFIQELRQMQNRLIPHNLALDSYLVSENLSRQIVLTNGTLIKLGRSLPFKKLQRFLNTLSLLGMDKVQAIQAIDTRYPNGYTVTWKTGSTITWSETSKTI